MAGRHADGKRYVPVSASSRHDEQPADVLLLGLLRTRPETRSAGCSHRQLSSTLLWRSVPLSPDSAAESLADSCDIGYETDSAADGNLYLYDLATNAYLDTFTPPSTWSAASASSAAESAVPPASSAVDVVPAGVIRTQTTLLVYTETQTAQSVVPALVTDAAGVTMTSSVTSAIATATVTASALATLYEVTLSSGSTSTVYPAALASLSTAAEADPSQARPVGEKPWDPATYTGIVPGYATLTTSHPAGGAPTESSVGDSSGDASADAGNGAMSSSKKAAIGVGSTFGFLALAALALGATVVVRKRRRNGSDIEDDEDEKAGLAGGRSRDWASQSGTWSSAAFGGAAGATWNDFTGRERKRVRLYDRLSEKMAGLGAAVGVGGSGGIVAGPTAGLLGRSAAGAGQGGRRWGMLDDEDTRRFETYPPPLDRTLSRPDSLRTTGDGEDAREADPFGDEMANRAGMGIFARSSSFAPIPESEEADGDLGYGRLHDEDQGDPFADGASAPSTAAGVTGIKRSAATSSFYPSANSATDYSTTPESSNHSSSSHRSHGDPYAQPPVSASALFYPQPSAPPSRSNSNSGWRKVLGLNLRTKSPPLNGGLTNLPPSVRVMGSRMRDLRDPATPPILGFDEDLEKGEWAGRRRKSFGQLGRGQDASLSSLTSARE